MATHHAMSHPDAAWLQMDRPTNLMVITSALWFDAPIDEQALRAVVQERLVDSFPRFKQRIAQGVTGPAWEDVPDFDLDLHIHHLALTAPGDQEVLQRTVGGLMSEALDRSRPLWAMYLLDGYGEGCAIVTRMHHAIADGIALARVMLSLTDDASGRPSGLEEPDDGVESQEPSTFDRVAAPLRGGAAAGRAVAGTGIHETVESILHPRHVTDILHQGGAYGEALLKLLTSPAERDSAVHGPLGTARRAAWSRPLSLPDVRRTGHLRGATVNDVLVAGVTGAMRSYLLAHDGDAQDIHAMVPFNLRPLDEPLPRDLGNRFGLVLLSLPAAVADGAERLDEVATRMLELKRSRQGQVTYGMLDAMGRVPASLEALVIDLMSAKAVMVLTNVPGPREPISFAGVPVAGVLVWAPCSGSVGMSISVFSYDGRVTVGFMTDGHLVPEPAELVDAFEATLAELGVGPA